MKLLSNTRPPSADSAAEPSSTSLQNKHSRATRVSLSPRAKKKKKKSWRLQGRTGPGTGTWSVAERQGNTHRRRTDVTAPKMERDREIGQT